jgi:hypothetical protein
MANISDKLVHNKETKECLSDIIPFRRNVQKSKKEKILNM